MMDHLLSLQFFLDAQYPNELRPEKLSPTQILPPEMLEWDAPKLKDWIFEQTKKKTRLRKTEKLLQEAARMWANNNSTWNSILTYPDDPFKDLKIED